MTNNMWQVGVARAVDGGCRSACVRVGVALQHGDVGVGLQAGSGEPVVFLNGVCYQLGDDCTASTAPNSARLCYCLVGEFDHYAPVFWSGGLDDLGGLRGLLDGRREVARYRNQPQLALATGRLRHAVLSGPRSLRAAGGDADEADAADKTVCEVSDAVGMVVGWRMPGYLAPGAPSGWRFIYLSEDRRCMGRLLGACDLSLACQITHYGGIDLCLPESREFNDLKLR